MKLSTQADYAVRAVYELARHDPGAVLHTGDIAAAQHIPSARLAKVIQDLAHADLVRTQRGQQGGVMLARPAERITVRDVYEAVEGPILLCRCRQRVEPCGDDACDTHAFWSSVETLLVKEMQTKTFAALARPPR
jgi:Rrf2 family iron-sulfur cluster assembly transcriptional regulator